MQTPDLRRRARRRRPPGGRRTAAGRSRAGEPSAAVPTTSSPRAVTSPARSAAAERVALGVDARRDDRLDRRGPPLAHRRRRRGRRPRPRAPANRRGRRRSTPSGLARPISAQSAPSTPSAVACEVVTMASASASAAVGPSTSSTRAPCTWRRRSTAGPRGRDAARHPGPPRRGAPAGRPRRRRDVVATIASPLKRTPRRRSGPSAEERRDVELVVAEIEIVVVDGERLGPCRSLSAASRQPGAVAEALLDVAPRPRRSRRRRRCRNRPRSPSRARRRRARRRSRSRR